MVYLYFTLEGGALEDNVFIWKNNASKNPINYNTSINKNELNHTYMLEENAFLRLEYLSTLIVNSSFANTIIVVSGNGTAIIRNCTFDGSKIIIDSIKNCTIESCHFIAKDESLYGKSHYMLNVYNTDSMVILHTRFITILIPGMYTERNNSQCGIKIDNVSLAEISFSSFRNIGSELNDGSVLSITNSEVHINQSQFISNVARNGVIYATQYVHLTNVNSSFIGSYAKGSGSVIYMVNNSTLMNIFCIFQNNTSGYQGGVFYMEQNVENINIDSSFMSNGALQGGSIYMKTFITSAIVNCSFSSNKVPLGRVNGGIGGVLFMDNNVESIIDDSIFNENEAESGGAIYIGNSVNVSVINSRFFRNYGYSGGVINTNSHMKCYFRNNSYINNRGFFGGVFIAVLFVNITNVDSIFSRNSADSGGVMFLYEIVYCSIVNCTFTHNTGILSTDLYSPFPCFAHA